MPEQPHLGRVVVLAPMPAEKSAYALARYSRSPDSVAESLAWVREHDSGKFLDSFYFQYGHASIADLGHCIFCFEGISEVAAIEIEDEQLWDGQAKSSRYQDFTKGSVVIPDEIRGTPAERTYSEAAAAALKEYRELHGALREHLAETLPKPPEMRPGAYRRTINARAFDRVRYLLFAGISTNVGQVVSIRTLEKQMRRMGVSEYAEVRSLAAEMRAACAAPPSCVLDDAVPQEAVAPTLAKYAAPDTSRARARARVAEWARQNFDPGSFGTPPDVDLVSPGDPLEEIAATWLYAVTDYPFRVIVEAVTGWSRPRCLEVIEAALEHRAPRAELMAPFRSGYRYVFDIVCDIGAYRDLHRHRRCQQIRQRLGDSLGCERPALLDEAGPCPGATRRRWTVCRKPATPSGSLQRPPATICCRSPARCRSLFKMDYAEVEYIARVRSGVKGHDSYRKVAWEMRERVLEREPGLGRLIQATPPWETDPLTR